jgi:tRNA threonylcarbamoyladenosine biosynthesis protein TsaE
VVEWGEGLAERLSDRHLDVRLERISNSDVRTATWQWSCRACDDAERSDEEERRT